MISYTLTKPTSLNQLLNIARGNKFKANALKQSETKKATKEIQEQHCVPIPSIVGKIFIAFDISYSTLTTDADNLAACVKPIMDGFVKAGIVPDDSLKHIQPTLYYSFTKMKRKEQRVLMNIFFNKENYQEYVMGQLETI